MSKRKLQTAILGWFYQVIWDVFIAFFRSLAWPDGTCITRLSLQCPDMYKSKRSMPLLSKISRALPNWSCQLWCMHAGRGHQCAFLWTNNVSSFLIEKACPIRVPHLLTSAPVHTCPQLLCHLILVWKMNNGWNECSMDNSQFMEVLQTFTAVSFDTCGIMICWEHTSLQIIASIFTFYCTRQSYFCVYVMATSSWESVNQSLWNTRVLTLRFLKEHPFFTDTT